MLVYNTRLVCYINVIYYLILQEVIKESHQLSVTKVKTRRLKIITRTKKIP